jgi:adenylate cyclase
LEGFDSFGEGAVMSRFSKAVTVGVLTGILGLVASLIPVGLHLEESVGLDLLFRMRGAREVPPDVIIVSMDKVSADNLNLSADPKKWPRSLHARLIRNLVKEGPAVIAFDIIFDEPSSAEHDELFAEAISNAGNVVLCECIKKETVSLTDGKRAFTGDLSIESLVPPIPPLARSALATAPFPLPRVPIRVSQYWTFKTGAGGVPTLPVVAFQVFALGAYDEFMRLYEKASPSDVKTLPHDIDAIIANKTAKELTLRLRDIFNKGPSVAERMLEELENPSTSIVDAKKNQICKSLIRMYQSPNSHYLNFYGPPGTITTVPYYRTLLSHEESIGDRKQGDLHGKAVFVGLSERLRPEQKDGFYTVFSQPSGLDISGVEIAATAFANLLEDMPVRPPSLLTYLAAIFFWGVMVGIVCRVLPSVIAAMSVIVMSALYLLAAQYQFKHTGIWYPLVLPLFFQAPLAFFGSVLWRSLDTYKERENIRKTFGYFLPDNVVDELAKNMADVRSSSQMVYGTCLYTDAEGYTTLSETMDPKKLGSFMNRYYEAIFEPVRQHGGIVSDVKGDSMLAIWAAAHPDAAIRNQACNAALDIASAVHRFNRINRASNTVQLPTRIALHSGHMLLGPIGGIHHYEYRALGDIVNTAERMERLSKKLSTPILVSKEVLYQLGGFLARELGKFLLVGKAKPIEVYELICPIDECNDQQRSLCAAFSQALSAYRRQSWDEAIQIFHHYIKVSGEDKPSISYLELCEKYRENPPGEVWDGLVYLNGR